MRTIHRKLGSRWLWFGAAVAAAAVTALVVFLALDQEGDDVRAQVPVPVPTELSHLEGPVNVIRPELPEDPGEPTMYGPYRLVPYGYDKPLTYEGLKMSSGPTGVEVTRDAEVARASSLYAEPAYLPEGYVLTHLSGMGRGDAEEAVALQYKRPGNVISVTRTRFTFRPLDVHLWAPGAGVAVETGTIAGAPAVFSYPKPETPFPLPVIVAFMEGDINTIVTARGFTREQPAPPLEEVIKIAESIR